MFCVCCGSVLEVLWVLGDDSSCFKLLAGGRGGEGDERLAERSRK